MKKFPKRNYCHFTIETIIILILIILVVVIGALQLMAAKKNISNLVQRTITEHQIQKAVIDWVKLNPSICSHIFSIPNESATNAIYGHRLKQRGLRPGASDLMIAMSRHGYHGCFIELKRVGGLLAPNQKIFIADMEKEGYFATVCWGIEEALELIKWYCFEKQ